MYTVERVSRLNGKYRMREKGFGICKIIRTTNDVKHKKVQEGEEASFHKEDLLHAEVSGF